MSLIENLYADADAKTPELPTPPVPANANFICSSCSQPFVSLPMHLAFNSRCVTYYHYRRIADSITDSCSPRDLYHYRQNLPAVLEFR